MKQILVVLVAAMLGTSAWAQESEMDSSSAEPYSRELVKKAETGDAKAQYSLGWAYFLGCKEPPIKSRGGLVMIRTILMQNTSVATDWFKKSAEQGYAEAQYMLGRCYSTGNGIEENEEASFQWYKKAAEQGFAKAEYALGVIYEDGKGAPKDEKEAVNWFKRSAEHGDLYGMFTYGEHLRNGVGVDKDEKESLKWTTIVAEEGYVSGQRMLGMLYARGLAVARR